MPSVEISSGKRLFLVGLVVSLTATALLAIGILLFAEFDDTSARVLATTGLIGLFSLLSLPASLLLDRGEARLLGFATIAAAAVGLVLSFVLIWGEVDDDTATSWAVTIALAAGALAQAAATTSRHRATDSATLRGLYFGAIAAGALLAVMLSWAAWGDVEDGTFYRFVGALAVADLLLVLLQPAVRRMGRAPTRTASRLVLTLDARPSEEAVAAAVDALERHGLHVENVDTRG
jgi:hypothetical protein